MTGILLRKNTKAFFTSNPPLEGELVYAEDTDEIGSLSGTEVIWQLWDAGFPDQFAYIGDTIPDNSFGEDGRRYIYKDNINSIINEYVKDNGAWRLLTPGVTGSWLTANIEPNFHSAEAFPYLGKYSLTMSDGFTTSASNDVVTKGYIDSVPGITGNIKINGSNEFDAGYVPTLDDDVVTLGYLMSGEGKLLLSEVDPAIEGVLWNDNGTLSISTVGGGG